MNEKEKDSDTRIYALDGLRGLAALAVVAYHYTGGTLRQLLPGAQFVTLFFILSGLVLSIVPLRVGIDTYNWPRYQLRRIARLAIPTCTAIGICCIVSTIAMHMGVESGRIRKRVQHILAISLATQSAHPTRHAFNDHRRHQSGRFHIGNGRPAIMEHVLGIAFQPRPARIRHHRHRHAIRGTHCARMRAVVGVDAVAAVASHGHVRAWRRVGETAYGQRARDDARRRCRTARPVWHRLGLPKRFRFAAWYCRPTFGRVRMPDIGGGRTYLQRGIRPAFHATCPLAGAHFIQPVSDPSSRPRLDCAVHSRAGSIAPGGFVCIVPSGSGGVLSCRGTACYQTVKEAGKGEKGSLMYFACAWCFRRNRRFA